MSGRKPLLEKDEPRVSASLAEFPLRDQALIALGLNTGFRITELLSLSIGQVWETGHVKPQVKVPRAKLKGGLGCRRKVIASCPDLEDVLPPKSGAEILGQLEADFPKFRVPGTSKPINAGKVKSLVDN